MLMFVTYLDITSIELSKLSDVFDFLSRNGQIRKAVQQCQLKVYYSDITTGWFNSIPKQVQIDHFNQYQLS